MAALSLRSLRSAAPRDRGRAADAADAAGDVRGRCDLVSHVRDRTRSLDAIAAHARLGLYFTQDCVIMPVVLRVELEVADALGQEVDMLGREQRHRRRLCR